MLRQHGGYKAAKQKQGLTAQLDAALKSFDEQQAKTKLILHSKALAADTSDSVCFSSLTWRNGVATVTFARDGKTYEYDVSRKEFLEWRADNEGLGEWFNRVLR